MSLQNLTNPDHTQALLALLLAETAHELRDWLANQQTLVASSAPLDNPAWGCAGQTPISVQTMPKATETPQKTSTQSSTYKTQTVSTVPPQAPSKANNRHSDTLLSMFNSLRSEATRPQLVTPTERALALEAQAARIGACKQCPLGTKRQNILPGYGPSDAKIMFVAAGGNPKELETGKIMTGEAATLLENIVSAMEKLTPEAAYDRIYMTNLIKCACTPPRAQMYDVARKCLPHLREEVAIVAPKVIVIWGELAFRTMFGSEALIAQVRGQVFRFEGIPAIPTHHPLEMLKNPKLKARTWADIQQAAAIMKN